MATGNGSPEKSLTRDEIWTVIDRGTPQEKYSGKRVLALTPDTTRTCPLPLIIDIVQDLIGSKADQLDYMVALGTHQPLEEERILDLYGISARERATKYSSTRFFNHRWDLADTFERVGHLSEEETGEISGGLLREKVPVDINRTIFDYDLILILGPVFPHEVVGFSGGAKYLFPGISGGDFLHFFHWLGAVVTCPDTIGIMHTPVREVINRAMRLIDIPVHCISMVVRSKTELYGIYAGDHQAAWEAAARLSEKIHVVYKDKQFHTVFGICPEMYGEVWTGGKVMYKLEQVVAPGGRLIIYAPHIREVSKTWGHYMAEIGYHTVGYFLAAPEKYAHIPRGVLAHSTHVRGVGVMENGREKPRIEVILASSIPEEECKKINLGYMDPRTIDPKTFKNREQEGILFVDSAGEVLHRVKRSSGKEN